MDKKKKNLPVPAVQMALFYDPDRHRMSWKSIPLSLKARVVECLAQLLCESSDTSDNGEDDDE